MARRGAQTWWPTSLLLAVVVLRAGAFSVPNPDVVASTKPRRIVVDLRSDTVTRPTAAMRKAMFEAEVGDDVFGDDPTVLSLETRTAALFGKESSLFFPSGTMANLAATMTWCSTRGSEMLLGDSSHMLLYEQGGAAQLAGVASRTVANKRDGTMSIDALESSLRAADNVHFPVTELLCLENTHNHCGGRILPEGYTEAVSWMARKRGVPLHIDGARIWNAATATNQPVSALAQHADSVMACFSKGLGAPVGSVLVGSSKFIAKARRARKALGGGMRQTGILAAAASVALDDFEAGVLAPSHSQAKILAKALQEMPGFGIDLDAVETNIILVHIDDDSPASPAVLADMMRERGVLVLAFGPKTLRIVTHRDISNEDIMFAIDAFREASKSMWPRPTVSSTADRSLNSSSSAALAKDILPSLDQFIREAGNAAVPLTRALEVAPLLDLVQATSPSIVDAAIELLAGAAGISPSPPTAPEGAAVMEMMSNQASVREAWERQALKDGVGSRMMAMAYNDVDVDVNLDQFRGEMSPSGMGAGAEKRFVTTSGIAEIEADESDQEYYEEAVVHGMSVSNEGFCVFLRGAVCDRLLKVHVTPSDPMADGLDSEQVETPEAVTLLQLLQGIDVESHLTRDALETKFKEAMLQEEAMGREARIGQGLNITAMAMGKSSGAKEAKTIEGLIIGASAAAASLSSSSEDGGSSAAVSGSNSTVVGEGIDPQELVLRRVLVTSVSKDKVQARLCGCVRRIDVVQEADAAADLSLVPSAGPAAGMPVATIQPLLQGALAPADMPFFLLQGVSTEGGNGALLGSVLAGGGQAAGTAAPFDAATVVSEKMCARVEVQSAFEAIGLALRHSAVIEVKSSLLQDPDLSYTLDELKASFPKLLEADVNFDASKPLSENYDSRNEMERLQRQLFEALRQGNQLKIASIKRHLELYSYVEGKSVHLTPTPPSSAPSSSSASDFAN